MTWFKVDDGLHSHRKPMRAGLEAMGLWAVAGSWSAHHLTNGFVPDYAVMRWGVNAAELAVRLVDAQLWVDAEQDGDTGWRFRNWNKWQPTRNQVELERVWWQRKTALYRDPELLKDIRARDKNRCRYCGSLVNWKDRRSTVGATYDAVDPQAGNTLVNIVVSCRGCFIRKANRALVDVPDMALLPVRASGPNQNRTSTQPDTHENEPNSEPELRQGKTRDTTRSEPEHNQGPTRTRPVPSSPVQKKEKNPSGTAATNQSVPGSDTTAGEVVAAWVEALTANGVQPSSAQRGQVGRLARELLAHNEPGRVLAAARSAGAKGFATIDRELTVMAAKPEPNDRWPGGWRPVNHDPVSGRPVDW
ncbi:HNH endonuclease [Lentzea sp. JNUCC 0626]|uniref:HNH endonuclease n=1 Tax=Lentzea sp. JNUCC 0626 TaxID=3367513 RepID=UPI00374A520B